MKLTNIADGPRGIFDKNGTMVTLNKGETRDVDLTDAEAEALNKEWFSSSVPQAEKLDRDAIKARADELKVEYPANIKTEALKVLVDEAEKKQA